MKLTKKRLIKLIKEAVIQERLHKIMRMLISHDLSTAKQGIELANAMGHDAELVKLVNPKGAARYKILTSSKELYHLLTSIGSLDSYGPAGPDEEDPDKFSITIRAR